VEFTVYRPDGPGKEYLESLGPLVTPERREKDADPD